MHDISFCIALKNICNYHVARNRSLIPRFHFTLNKLCQYHAVEALLTGLWKANMDIRRKVLWGNKLNNVFRYAWSFIWNDTYKECSHHVSCKIPHFVLNNSCQYYAVEVSLKGLWKSKLVVRQFAVFYRDGKIRPFDGWCYKEQCWYHYMDTISE